jgi:methylmalonyl-CoA mutase N-terminal domain/subunit
MMHAEEGISFDAENRQDDSNVEGTQIEHRETYPTNARNQQSTAQEASAQARQRRRIAQLEEKLELLESGRAVKEKYVIARSILSLPFLTVC